MSRADGTLDFLVIGAQKAGTSAMTIHLGEHPELSVPQQTAGFFDSPRYERKLPWLLANHFADASRDAKLGTVTPAYMTGTDRITVPQIAERVHATIPAVRLIAIVRDPIERCISAWRMSHRRGDLPMTFDVAVMSKTEPRNPLIENSLYGKLLTHYANLFPPEQLLVLTSEELMFDGAGTLRRVFEHIGVDPDFVPQSTGERIHTGGTTTRLPAESSRMLTAYLEDHWFAALSRPQQLKQRAEFFHWFERFNIIPDEERPEVGQEVREKLIRMFIEDALLLEPLMGRMPPWIRGDAAAPEWRGHGSPGR